VRDELGAKILEWLAAGDVVVMMMTVDHVLDRLVRDFLDLVDINRDRLGPRQPDRVRRDDSRGRDAEHRLAVLVAEDVDVIRALDLGGRERGAFLRWRRRRLVLRSGRHRRCGHPDSYNCKECALHGPLQSGG
jgi:hypothetical protein